MADGYAVVDYETAERTTSEKSDVLRVELADLLGCEQMGVRVWTIQPGESLVYHFHREQEELYVSLERAGRIRVDGEVIDVPVGSAVRVAPETPRQLFNDGEAAHTWLVVGAPPVEDDGVHLDDPV